MKTVRRLDALLNWRRARVYGLMVIALYTTAWVYVIVTGNPPLNSSGEPIGGDYIAFYSAGQIVRDGNAAHLYDKPTIQEVQSEILGGRIPNFYDPFRNPPFMALIYVPLSLIPWQPSLYVWSAVSLACLALAVRLLREELPGLRAGFSHLIVAMGAFAPLYFNLIDGENAFLSLLLYVLWFRAMVHGQDRWAGVWAALGLFKPQLFFVFPLIFLATKRWQALWSYLATAVVLTIVSVAIVGPEGAIGWFRILVDLEPRNATSLAWRMHSLKAFFDLLLPAAPVAAFGLYAALGAALLGALLVAWRQQRASLSDLWVLTVLTAILLDPHLVEYDLTVLMAAAPMLVMAIRPLRWLLIVLGILLVFRAQVPVADVTIQATTVLLAIVTIVWLRRVFSARSTTAEFPRTSPDTRLRVGAGQI